MESGLTNFYISLFIIAVMWLLLDIRFRKLTKTGKVLLVTSLLVILGVNVLLVLLLGPLYPRMLPLVLHLPVIICFYCVSIYRGVKLLFVFLTALVACTIPSIVMRRVPIPNAILKHALIILICLLMLYAIFRFFKPSFLYILKHGAASEFWKYCFIPLFFCLSIFLQLQLFTKEPQSLRELFFVQIPLCFTLFSYYLLLSIFKETNERRRLQSEQDVIRLHLDGAARYLEELKSTQEGSIIFRHDMRHHLALLRGYADNGDMAQVQTYLADMEKITRMITPEYFCQNKTLSLILSSFSGRAKEAGVALCASAELPAEIPISDTELCVLVSNGLENAIAAAAQMASGKKQVRFVCKMHANTLMFLFENPCAAVVPFEHGLPISDRAGHGIGVKSIANIVNKHGGYYSFKAQDNLFTLRIAL